MRSGTTSMRNALRLVSVQVPGRGRSHFSVALSITILAISSVFVSNGGIRVRAASPSPAWTAVNPRLSWHFAHLPTAVDRVTLVLVNPSGMTAKVWLRTNGSNGVDLWSVDVGSRSIRSVPLPSAAAIDAVTVAASTGIIVSRLIRAGRRSVSAFGEPGPGTVGKNVMPLPEQKWRFPALSSSLGEILLTVYNPNQTAVTTSTRFAGIQSQVRLRIPARASAEVSLTAFSQSTATKALEVLATGPVVPQRWVIGRSGVAKTYGTVDAASPTLRSFPWSIHTLAERINRKLLRFTRLSALSGSVLITRRSHELLTHAYGFANRAQSEKAQLTTAYPIRGLTTTFTAAAILQLQDRGRLSTADRVCRYLPTCPLALRAVTINHLLTHTSGLPRNGLDPSRPFTTRELLNSFGSAPSRFTPGTKWRFSDTGYVLLGAIIEKVAGVAYRTYIHESILHRLGMTHSGFVDESSHPPLALGYHGTLPATKGASRSYDPAWGMYSTVVDLEKFNGALNSPLVLSASAIRAMFATHVIFPNGSGYGYAWNSGRFQGHPFNISYGGNTPGYAAVEVRLPNDKIGIIVLTNQDGVSMADVVLTLLQTVLRG